MADTKRAQGSNDKRKKKYRSDGTSIWAKRYIDGPGIWALKERNVKRSRSAMTYSTQFVQLPQILTVRLISVHKVASELWPTETHGNNADSDSDDEEDQDLSIEDQIANEVNAIKKSKKEPRFGELQLQPSYDIFTYSIPYALQSTVKQIPPVVGLRNHSYRALMN
ncbi:hypothetical protein C0991_009968 [Blastosporella zonata]|nr:hypothetical protein C0991_009968 [Blastosporella zonata]